MQATAVVFDCPVVDLRASELAKPDQQHFQQATFDISEELCVRLDAVAHQHVIRVVRLSNTKDMRNSILSATIVCGCFLCQGGLQCSRTRISNSCTSTVSVPALFVSRTDSRLSPNFARSEVRSM